MFLRFKSRIFAACDRDTVGESVSPGMLHQLFCGESACQVDVKVRGWQIDTRSEFPQSILVFDIPESLTRSLGILGQGPHLDVLEEHGAVRIMTLESERSVGKDAVSVFGPVGLCRFRVIHHQPAIDVSTDRLPFYADPIVEPLIVLDR